MTIDRAIEILNPEHREHYESLEEVNEACRMGMEALQRTRWIPCSERPPKNNQRVLFWVSSPDAVYAGFYSYTGKRGTVWFRSGKTDYASKYWMPAPKAPEENEVATASVKADLPPSETEVIL